MKHRWPKYVCRYLEKKGLPLDIALTFEDVTIVDIYSKIISRSDEHIDTSSDLGKGIRMPRPIFSANMDTITESKMAIAMARLGGCGVIHQFLPIEKRVSEAEKVKRADNYIVQSPLTIAVSATIKEARELMAEYHISGLMVTEDDGQKLAGVLSRRDVCWAPDHLKIRERMTPIAKMICAGQDISIESAKEILYQSRLEKLPLVSPEGRLAGLITASDILKRERFNFAFRDGKGRLGVAAAVGVGKYMLKECEALLKAETDILFIDTARGNSAVLKNAVKEVRRIFGDKITLAAGNVDTPAGMEMLYEAGADLPKEGIGGGSACKTRKGPGVGVPKITSAASCAAVARKHKKSFISDGGVKGPDDYCKLLAAGADAVMLGGILAATEETPGSVFFEDGERWKVFRGSASLEFQLSRTDRDPEDNRIRAPEGVPKRERYKGEVAPIINELVAFQHSAMSYVGAKNMGEMHRYSYFVRQTDSGYEEGKPHDTF